VFRGKWKRKREFALFYFTLGAFAFFAIFFLHAPALFFWFRARKREKSAGAHI
jgi:hypothetical protein